MHLNVKYQILDLKNRIYRVCVIYLYFTIALFARLNQLFVRPVNLPLLARDLNEGEKSFPFSANYHRWCMSVILRSQYDRKKLRSFVIYR